MRLLVIGHQWPDSTASAAGSRMMQLIKMFDEEGYEITFSCTAQTNETTSLLESLGIKTQTILLNHSSFDEFLKKINPDTVLFDRFMMEEQFGWRVAEACPNALRMLDTEDLHFLRKARQIALKDRNEIDTSLLQNELAKREIASIYRCDLSLIISETEMEILTEQFQVSEKLLHYIPFLLDEISEEKQEKLPQFSERNNFIFIGNFLHAPNVDAVLYLKKHIWSQFRDELPKAELHIYGAYATQQIQELHNIKEGFLIKGKAQEVASVMREAKVNLAPLRFGAGLKGKLLEAMLYGTPSVTSSVGVEGMCGDLPFSGFIEDDAKQFIEAAIRLYVSEEIWKEFQQNGYEILTKRFQKKTFKNSFFETIKQLQKQLKLHRQQNFIGQLLQHHSMQSTKFMSKWIEEKNK